MDFGVGKHYLRRYSYVLHFFFPAVTTSTSLLARPRHGMTQNERSSSESARNGLINIISEQKNVYIASLVATLLTTFGTIFLRHNSFKQRLTNTDPRTLDNNVSHVDIIILGDSLSRNIVVESCEETSGATLSDWTKCPTIELLKSILRPPPLAFYCIRADRQLDFPVVDSRGGRYVFHIFSFMAWQIRARIAAS